MGKEATMRTIALLVAFMDIDALESNAPLVHVASGAPFLARARRVEQDVL